MLSLLALLACDTNTPKTTPVAGETPVVEEITADANGAYHLSLDQGGGSKGAPQGMAFLFPPGAAVEAKSGPLSDGSTGFRFAVPEEGTPVVCTLPLPITTKMTFGTRMRLSEIKPGPQKFMGLAVELRNRDAQGNLLSPAGGRYVSVKVLREAGDWQSWEADVEPVEGAVSGEFCFRFARATGVVEVDQIAILPVGMHMDGAATAAVAPSPSATAPVESPTCPSGCCPCDGANASAIGAAVASGGTNKKPKVGLPVKWDLNEPGGKNGAPKGFEFIAGNGGATKVSLTKGEDAGLHIETTATDSAVVCSDRFPSAGRLLVHGRVAVDDYKSNGKKNSGFLVELRSFDASDHLVGTQQVRFQRLFVAQTVVPWFEFSKGVEAPDAAVISRVCARFTEATGKATIDWLSVNNG